MSLTNIRSPRKFSTSLGFHFLESYKNLESSIKWNFEMIQESPIPESLIHVLRNVS